MKTYRIGNWFFEFIYINANVIQEEIFKLFSFDTWKVKGYELLSTLSKAHFNNYRYIEIDLFRSRLLITFGIRYKVDYEFAREERRKLRAKHKHV